jgi:hypothetical protein
MVCLVFDPTIVGILTFIQSVECEIAHNPREFVRQGDHPAIAGGALHDRPIFSCASLSRKRGRRPRLHLGPRPLNA